MALPAIVRGLVRGMIRQGATRRAILDRVASTFPWSRPQQVGTIISQELKQNAIATNIINADKRRTIDLATLAGCPAGTERVRIGITISYLDPRTGDRVERFGSQDVSARGRLADIVNDAIRQTIGFFDERGYDIPQLTSAATAGPTHYRVDFVRC